MEKQQVINSIKEARKGTKQRKFKQSFDFIISLRGIDLKKPEHQVDVYISLPFGKGKKPKICTIVGPELLENAKKSTDHVILIDNAGSLKKNEIKNLARDYDYFIAQANIMPKVATSFGRVFGPRGKMPNPKSGGVVPPNANLKPVYEKFQRTVRATTKSAPLIQCGIGSEDMSVNEITDNALTVYNAVLHALPNEKHNIKDIYIKLTMGKPVKVGEKLEVTKETK